MIDTMTQKPIEVDTDGESEGGYLDIPLEQLDPVVALLKANAIPHWVDEEALSMDAENANVHLNLGVARKLKGELLASRASLEKAKSLDPKGPIGGEADRLLAGMPKPPSSAAVGPLKPAADPL